MVFAILSLKFFGGSLFVTEMSTLSQPYAPSRVIDPLLWVVIFSLSAPKVSFLFPFLS